MIFNPKPFRLSRSGFFCVVLFASFCAPLAGQFKFREPPNRQLPDSLSESVGQDFWSWFLYNRSAGEFKIGGTLTHRPAGAPSVTYDFSMEGDWQPFRQETAIVLVDPQGESTRRRVVVDGGQARLILEEGESVLVGSDWQKPVIENFPITWMDLLMPYFEWEDVSYKGPDRYLGRPTHRFMLSNPEPESSPAKVMVTLDADYAAVLKADLLDQSNMVIKRMRVGGFKKFGEDWMFSELNWENRLQRSSIRLKVSSYKSNLH